MSDTVKMEVSGGAVDTAAPGVLVLNVVDAEGKPWGTLIATARVFSTGSRGFYASGKIVNPANPAAVYQVGANVILTHSGPGKTGKKNQKNS